MRKFFLLLFPVLLVAGTVTDRVSLNPQSLQIREVSGYTLIDYPDAHVFGPAGAPMVPRISLQVLLPSGAVAEGVEIIRVETTIIPLKYPLYPQQKPVPLSRTKEAKFLEPDPKYYSLEKYPAEIIQVANTGYMAGYTIAGLILNPVIYRPEEGYIEFINEIEYRVNYVENRPMEQSKKQIEVFGSLVKGLVRNPQDAGIFAPRLKDIKDPDTVEMVIITSSTFAPYFDSLKKWKEMRGIPTRVVTLDYIYSNYTGRDNPEKIRNFIIDYHQNKSLLYVLLGGQADHENNQAIVPRRDVFYYVCSEGSYPDEDTIPCDLYYSDLTGTWNNDNDNIWGELSDNVDMYPDVFVGRFPIKNVNQLNNLIGKVITYELNPPSGYLTNIVLPAELLWNQFPYYGDSVNNRIANVTPTPPWNDIKLYRSLGNLSTTSFLNAVNSGVGYAHYASHGNETSASFVGMSNFNSLNNGNKFGIHNAMCCFTGAIDEVAGGDCFAESLVNHTNGGAVATIMNTRYGWGYPPSLGPSELIDSSFYYHIFTNNVWTVGEAHALSLADWVPTAVAEGGSGVYRWCIYELWIFGDPSLQGWTNEPTAISASYSSEIPAGISSFDVYTDAPGAVVALSKDGTLVGRAITDATGYASVPIGMLLAPSDNVSIAIRVKDRLTHVGSIEVDSSGAFVWYQGSTIEEISGNGNGRINPGEDLKLYVMLKNYGQDAATNVNATLTTTNSHITITDNSANYGTIDPYDSTYGSEWFEFTVDYAAVDQEVIPFEINITSNEDSWTSSFNYNVYAPMLSYLRVQVNDSEGNGNGLIDPGETVTLRVYARNSGHEDAPGVVGKLTCTDTRVVFNNNNLSMGDIAVGGNGYADFSVTFGSDIEIGEIIPIGLRLTSSNLVFLSEFVVFMGAQYYTTSFEGDDYLVWTYENPWARRSDQRYHGSYSLGTGVYSNNMNASLYTPSFIVMSQCTLSFYEWSNFENNFDLGYVEYRLNGGSWVQLSQRSGDNRIWQRAQYVISGNPGDTLAIRFRATSDGSLTRDGWYIDSLKVGPVIFIPSLQYVRYEVEEVEGNGNGVHDPGETVNLYLVLGNSLAPVRNVEGHLVAMDENSEVLDSVSIYGDIESFGSSTGDGFRVSIVPSVDIEGLSYRLYVVGSGYSDTIDISLPVGRYVGPCNYGYRAFTDLSFYEGLSPEYSWIEIKNIGTQIASTGDDVYASVTLPFTFKFFGTNQTSLTVSSNGWVGFGAYSSAYFSNTGIPNSSSPNNIVAITWDDLNPNAAGSGKIWYYHDTESHIFIVEYDSVYHYGTSVPLKAEVILYNPAYYPTVTGDGDIVIQYKVTPGQDDYTCGIENASGNDGIGYYYDGTYAAGADPIVAGRAIKFTTDTTGLVFGVEEHNPRAVKLLGVSSNPLRGQGYVAFELPARAVIKVELINVQGRVVKTLASGVYDRGYHRVKVDGTSLPQGIYFVRLNTETRDEISKFLIVK